LMTGPQTKAHGKLVKETLADGKSTERANGPAPDDPWAQPTPGADGAS
jgi:hypothetical protein